MGNWKDMFVTRWFFGVVFAVSYFCCWHLFSIQQSHFIPFPSRLCNSICTKIVFGRQVDIAAAGDISFAEFLKLATCRGINRCDHVWTDGPWPGQKTPSKGTRSDPSIVSQVRHVSFFFVVVLDIHEMLNDFMNEFTWHLHCKSWSALSRIFLKVLGVFIFSLTNHLTPFWCLQFAVCYAGEVARLGIVGRVGGTAACADGRQVHHT